MSRSHKSHGLRVQSGRLRTPCSDSLSLRLPFRLALPVGLTRGLIMQKASGRVPKDAPTACGRTISGLFHSPSGVLFAFPSRYLFAIGHHGVIRLGGWSPRIRAGFHVSRPTWDPSGPRPGFRLRGFHPLRPDLPVRSPSLPSAVSWSRNPEVQAPRFGLTRFRSPLLARSRLLSFPQGTEMFHFPWSSPSGTIEFIPGCHGSRHGGLPHSEISGSMPVDGSPEPIAVCRVLLRLVMPRHPSCARIRLAGKIPPLAYVAVYSTFCFHAPGCQRSLASWRTRRPPLGANGQVVYQIAPRRARGKMKKPKKSRRTQ